MPTLAHSCATEQLSTIDMLQLEVCFIIKPQSGSICERAQDYDNCEPSQVALATNDDETLFNNANQPQVSMRAAAAWH